MAAALLIVWSPAWTGRVHNMPIRTLQSIDLGKQNFEKAAMLPNEGNQELARALPIGLKTEGTRANLHEQDRALTTQILPGHGSAKAARVPRVQNLTQLTRVSAMCNFVEGEKILRARDSVPLAPILHVQSCGTRAMVPTGQNPRLLTEILSMQSQRLELRRLIMQSCARRVAYPNEEDQEQTRVLLA